MAREATERIRTRCATSPLARGSRACHAPTAQARSTSNVATLRASLPNSTAIRWIGWPKLRRRIAPDSRSGSGRISGSPPPIPGVLHLLPVYHTGNDDLDFIAKTGKGR